jgi:RND family efflux transporter MFP subunit
MKAWVRWLLLAIVAVAVAGVGFWFGSRSSPANSANASAAAVNSSSASAGSGPVVPVSTAVIERKRITEMVIVYGRIIAQPGAIRVLSLPYEAIVSHVLVAVGQPVQAGTVLIRIEPSPATRLQFEQAKAALSSATRNLEQVQQEYDQHLAITNQLIAAQKGAEAARLQVAQLEREGAGHPHAITTHEAGVVAAVSTQDGQIAAPGTPLVAVAVGHRLEAELGVEPEDAAYVHIGDPIRLAPVNAVKPGVLIGHVRVVGQKADPKTQLINVEVSLPNARLFSLSSFVEGKLTTGSRVGLVVPREALLPKGGRRQLFTIVNGKADEHVVQTGLETDREIEIKDSGLHAGQRVVTQGNYELSSGTIVSGQDVQ